MSTAMASASATSRNTQPTSFSSSLQALPLSAIVTALAAALLMAACASAPEPAPPKAPPVAAAPEPLVCPPVEKPTCPAPPSTEPPAAPPTVDYRGRLQAASWLDLPLWKSEPVRPALEAFARGCAVLGQQEAWKGVCAGAHSVLAEGGEREAASFFELNFEPY